MKHSPPPPPSYAPDDGGISVQSLEFLNSSAGESLRAEAAALFAGGREPSVAQVAAIRKKYSADHVRAALALGGMQEKGRQKFPGLPYVWGTPEALEQASGRAVARWKAQRFAAAGVSSGIVDLCAGIGGDALALAEVGRVTAVDLSAVRMKALAMNAAAGGGAVETITAAIEDVLPTLPREALFHIDPARRSKVRGESRRSSRYEDLIPSPDVLGRVIRHFRGGAIKLSPGVAFESLPEGALEVISQDGAVVQAVLYCGEMGMIVRHALRIATVLREGQAPFSYEAAWGPPVVAPELPEGAGHLFYELDGALTRVGVAGAFAREMGLLPVTVDGGYLVSGAGQGVMEHPALTVFRLLKIVPFSEKRLSQELRELPPTASGAVEVKTRGLPEVPTDHLQRVLTKAAPGRRTVLLFRHGQRVMAAVAERVDRTN